MLDFGETGELLISCEHGIQTHDITEDTKPEIQIY
jgi:hypothetical protein